jgi:hypothetical protein
MDKPVATCTEASMNLKRAFLFSPYLAPSNLA